MLYILGGAARSGKSTLARKFVDELKVPYFSVDQILIALEKGAPELGITHEQTTLERAPKLWSIFKPMLMNIYESEPEYAVDGDVLLPKYIKKLSGQIKKIKACYLGYAHIDPGEKLNSIKKYDGPNNWTQGMPDEKILQLISSGIDFSKYLEKEAPKYNFKYFDTSFNNFQETIQKAFDHLVS